MSSTWCVRSACCLDHSLRIQCLCLLHCRLPSCGLSCAAELMCVLPCPQVSPLKGNVAFTAALYGWSFTLESFATLYCEVHRYAIGWLGIASRC